MPTTELRKVKELKLDLQNFRTIPQVNEEFAVKAMISINPDRFWALMESLIDDGYLPTENVIVLSSGVKNLKYTVKEGNRRVAGLKIVFGYLTSTDFGIPKHIQEKIAKLTKEWKAANEAVPCAIYAMKDALIVDKIVSLAHGKGEKASRDHWTAVAKARHNRDINKSSEPALNILEAYIKVGKNITGQQKERWAGDYPITVLDEAIKKLAVRLGAINSIDLSTKYPSLLLRDPFEDILRAIGLGTIGFTHIRSATDFAAPFGIPPLTPATPSSAPTQGQSTTPTTGNTSPNPTTSAANNNSTSTTSNSTNTQPTTQPQPNATAPNPPAYAINDPRAVTKALKQFNPRGPNRQKVVTLRDEALNLNLQKNPIAFCFLLRSMFEISAKAYCNDHSLPLTKANGKEMTLAELLNSIKTHLTNNNSNMAMVKVLHGAAMELSKPDGILSVTSMNHLVHNPTFSVTAGDISTMFGNIYPLLEAMN